MAHSEFIGEVIALGAIYSFVVMGCHLSLRVARVEDLTVEGSFGIGAAVTSILLVQGINPLLALLASIVSGGISGALAAFLHQRFSISALVSGLCVTCALFSVSLKLVGAHVSLLSADRMVENKDIASLLFVLGLAGSIHLGFKWFLETECGLMLRSSGENPQWVESQGRNPRLYQRVTLLLANCLTALSGSLFVQWSGFFSVSGNVGVLVAGLSGLILSEICQSYPLRWILGAVLYQSIFACTLMLGIDPSLNYLIKALSMVFLLASLQKRRGIHAYT